MNWILIAEDEPRIAAFIEKGLRRQGYQTIAVNTGIEALEIAQSRDIELLLLDLGLPGKDGWTVLRELWQAARLPDVIIVTAQDDIQDKLLSLEFGVAGCITKPFKFSDLLTCVEAALSN